MGKGSLLDFCGKEDRENLLNFRSAVELAPKIVAVKVEPQKPAPVTVDICEFVRSFVYGGSDGRFCVDGTFCPSRIYGNSELFRCCDTRRKRLRERL